MKKRKDITVYAVEFRTIQIFIVDAVEFMKFSEILLFLEASMRLKELFSLRFRVLTRIIESDFVCFLMLEMLLLLLLNMLRFL